MPKSYIQFDKGKPFYDMVSNLMVALSACPAIFNSGNPMQYDPSQYITVNGVHVAGKHLRPYEVYEQAQGGHTTLPLFIGHTCMLVANLAYESVKHLNDHSPEFEFFRHVRNAASHKNQFSFAPKEPKYPAAWRSAIIAHTQKGPCNPLHGQQCFGTLLGPADLVELLADIEIKLPGLP